MQYRPTAAELLGGIAEFLDTTLLPALGPELQHPTRVAASLARIVARECEFGSANATERTAIADLLDQDAPMPDLQREFARRIRSSNSDTFDRAAWQVLVDIARSDVAIAKPGYDDWESE